jgi:hypothetical protein
MPTASQIVAGLTAVANENLGTALGWHVILGGAIASILIGWRPSRRTAFVLMSGLPASVSGFAFQYGNPFNGIAFGLLTGVLLFNGIGADDVLLRRKTSAATVIGSGLIAFGWLYPHFLQSQPLFMYAFVAPTGLIPCPTLAVLTGVTVLLSGLSRSWSIVLGVFGLFYGAFGVLRLGVWLDVGLLGGAVYLLTLRESSRPADQPSAARRAPEQARTLLSP